MSWPHPSLHPQIVYHTTTQAWQCLVRELPDGAYKSIEGPVPPPHRTPDAALAAVSARVSSLISAREEATAVEVLQVLKEGRLERRTRAIMSETGTPQEEVVWIARDNEIESAELNTPESAVKDLKAKLRDKQNEAKIKG